jgi:type IV secretion system protein VirB8
MGSRDMPGVDAPDTTTPKKKLTAYLQEVRTWETGEVLNTKKSERRAWCVAGVSIVAGLLGLASSAFQASKEAPMPVVLRWNEITGVVQRLDSLAEGKITPGEATSKYFAQLYVQYRESWDKATAKQYYYNVGLMSNEEEQKRWVGLFQSEQSPAKLYGDNVRVRIIIKGTSFLSPGVASVRYVRVVERPNVAAHEASDHTATVAFSYSSGRMSEYDRSINPLGFQANYRSDPDTPGMPPVLVPAPGARPAPAAPAAPPALPAAAPAAPLDLRTLQERGK